MESGKKVKVVFVDICGTLYRSNTTFDFLDFYLHTLDWRIFRSLSKCFAWRAVNKLLVRYLQFDLTRTLAVRFLGGIPSVELDRACARFYEDYLEKRKNIPVFERISSLKKEGVKLYLASATLDFIACRASAHCSIEVVLSTRLDYAGLVCQGKIHTEVLGNKYDRLTQANKLEKPYGVITDNLSDWPLVRPAAFTYIVTYRHTIGRWQRLLKGVSSEKYEFISF